MRAFVINRYGGPEVLKAGELPEPAVGTHDVLIEVHAASVNPIDWKLRDGKARPILPLRFPIVLGCDLSGVVRRVGGAVTRFKEGDEVFVRLDQKRIGAFAEFAVASEDGVALKPKSIGHVEAASIPLVGLTAYQALVDDMQLQPGQSVLIHGGSGGVGAVAVQLAHWIGAKVIATAGKKNLDRVKALGADQVIDYANERFEDAVTDVDFVLDTQGGETLMRSFKAVKPGGLVVSISGMPDAEFARAWGMKRSWQALFGMLAFKIHRAAKKRGARYRYLFMQPNGEQLAKLGALIDEKRLAPHVDRVFPFEQTPEAIAYAESGAARGKVVVQVR